jgi:hypothetical protein
MKHRVFDWLLLVVALIGGVLAWQTGRERNRLSERHRRLVEMAGELPIADPSKMYIRALDTGELLHFAWRVYLPANYNRALSSSGGSSLSSSTSRRPSEFIARLRFRQDEQGVMEVYNHFANGSTRISIGDQTLADLLRNRWDRVRVEQLGAPEVAVIEPDQSAVLLRLTLPDDMKDEARAKLSPDNQARFLPVLYELNLGLKP